MSSAVHTMQVISEDEIETESLIRASRPTVGTHYVTVPAKITQQAGYAFKPKQKILVKWNTKTRTLTIQELINKNEQETKQQH